MYSPLNPDLISVTFIPAPAGFKFPGYRVDLRLATDKNLTNYTVIYMIEFDVDCQVYITRTNTYIYIYII